MRASKYFPAIAIRSGDAVPSDCQRGALAVVAGAWADAGALLRLDATARSPNLRIQVLDQTGGYQTVLLHLEAASHDDDVEDTALIESYTTRLNRR